VGLCFPAITLDVVVVLQWRNLQNAIERVACDKKKGDLSRDLVERICR